MVAHLTKVTMQGPMWWIRRMVICMTVKRLGMLGVSVRKMMALTMKMEKMEKVTLIGTGKENLTCSVYSVYAINNKIFFLADVLPFGGRLRLESFCILVNTVCFILMLKKTRTDAWKDWPYT
jgi:hypothetical protein